MRDDERAAINSPANHPERMLHHLHRHRPDPCATAEGQETEVRDERSVYGAVCAGLVLLLIVGMSILNISGVENTWLLPLGWCLGIVFGGAAVKMDKI